METAENRSEKCENKATELREKAELMIRKIAKTKPLK